MQTYLVGGAVRDQLLGLKVKDRDWVVVGAGLTGLASTPKQAMAITIVTSFVCYYLNWGFGMVAGAILAREMGRRVHIHFPLIVAAAYGGELVRGPSSSPSPSSPALMTQYSGGWVSPVQYSP